MNNDSGRAPSGQALVASDGAQEVSTLTGFDPSRDGFPLSRLLMVASNLAVETTKEVAELAYGSWNPNCMARDAAREALSFFASLKRHIEHYERQAASAIEARRAATPQSDAVHESAASEAGDAPTVEVRP